METLHREVQFLITFMSQLGLYELLSDYDYETHKNLQHGTSCKEVVNSLCFQASFLNCHQIITTQLMCAVAFPRRGVTSPDSKFYYVWVGSELCRKLIFLQQAVRF